MAESNTTEAVESQTTDTQTPTGENTEEATQTAGATQEENIETIRAEYEKVLGKSVSNAKKNDAEWMKSKIEEAQNPTQTAGATGGKIKIKLLCDVLTNDGKLKEWETLEVTQEQLDTFAKSFYERA